ncbi:MAG TPA: hypothetical protein VIV11_23185, partial [Kofleriaceae bacterium]
MQRWWRYWFADGGRRSTAILRIGIAIAVWMILDRMQGAWPANAPGAPEPPEVYHPIGIWMLFGRSPPSNAVIDVLWVVARISTVAMFVGAFSRVSTALSFVSTLALVSVSYGGAPGWSHPFNVVMLAQLAFLGARGGDTLSIDALVRKRRGLPAENRPHAYQWSIRLVQLAVAVMFASGAFHKLVQGGFTLDWALSDNLRHQLLVRFDLAGQPRSAIADWLIDDVWRYRTAALLNLLTQLVPLAACFLVRRPILRAACGAFFVIETLALGFVMELWNLWWIPLAVVFVDWDALTRAPAPGAAATTGPLPTRIFIIAFAVYHLATAFVPRIDQKLNTYPFSSFPMFASIRARKPYSEHLPYSLASSSFEALSPAPVNADLYPWLDHAYRRTYSERRPDELRKRLAAILADARFLDARLAGMRIYYTIFEAPAYPAPARIERKPIAVIGELDGETFRSLLGTAKRNG